jgi:hypothetical protein
VSSDGHILLELINALAPHDLTQVPANPYDPRFSNGLIKLFTYVNNLPRQYINNDEWDKVQIARKDSQDEVEKLALAHILVLRTKLISAFVCFFFLAKTELIAPYSFFFLSTAHVLQFIICSFLGRELPRITVQRRLTPTIRTAPTPNPLEQNFTNKPCLQSTGKKKLRRSKLHTKQHTKSGLPRKVIFAVAVIERLRTRNLQEMRSLLEDRSRGLILLQVRRQFATPWAPLNFYFC